MVHILETLDDKIKLNRRQNTTLEAMAQAIFKEWFVDFGPVRAKMEGRQPEGISREIADLFPDRLDDEGKPEGWERKKLGDLITFYSERIKSDKLTESNYVSTENMLSDKKGITKASSLPTTDSVLGIYWFQIYVHISKKYGLLLLMEDDQMMFSIFALQ